MDEKWVEIGSITLNRKDCLVATNKISIKVVIVGGRYVDDGSMRPLDLVQECSFKMPMLPPYETEVGTQ